MSGFNVINDELIKQEPEAPAFNFHVAVKEAIAEATPQVKDRLIQVYVEKELLRFQEAIARAITHLDSAKNDLKKIKPDVQSYNEDGEVTSNSYSKDVAESLKSTRTKVAKLEEAVKAALVDNDYSKVLNLK